MQFLMEDKCWKFMVIKINYLTSLTLFSWGVTYLHVVKWWDSHCCSVIIGASPVTQMVKNPPVMQETWVQSLDWEGPLEKGTAAHSKFLAWRIPWTESFVCESQRVRYDWAVSSLQGNFDHERWFWPWIL